LRLRSSPKFSRIDAFTAPPRVCFGRSASFTPPGSSLRVDVRRGRIEFLAFAAHSVALVAVDERRDARIRRDHAAVGLARNEHADRSIRGLEIFQRRALHVFDRSCPRAVAVDEHQPPVTDRGPLAELQSYCLRVVHRALEVRERGVTRAIDLLLGERLGLDRIECREQRSARGIERGVFRDHRVEDHRARIPLLQRVDADVGRELLLDQGLVQSARRLVGERARCELQRHEVGMSAARRVIRDHDDLDVADATHGDVALAFLDGLDGVAGR
jgi:hypothetical protein